MADIDGIGIDAYSRSLPLKRELASQRMICYSTYWENAGPLVKIPLSKEMDFPIDVGLGCKVDSSPAVAKFIAAAKEAFPGRQAFARPSNGSVSMESVWGYNNLNYFYRTFKTQTGLTPREYVSGSDAKGE